MVTWVFLLCQFPDCDDMKPPGNDEFNNYL